MDSEEVVSGFYFMVPYENLCLVLTFDNELGTKNQKQGTRNLRLTPPPGLLDQSQPIAVENVFDIFLFVTTFG